MNVEELQKLLDAATPGGWTFSPWHVEEGASAVRAPQGWIVANTSSDDNARLIALAPTLARQVIAAQKLVEALNIIAEVDDDGWTSDGHERCTDFARAALAEWEAAQ